MNSVIPVMPAGRGPAGRSKPKPVLPSKRSRNRLSGAPAHSGAAVVEPGVGGTRLSELFWQTAERGTDAGTDICSHLFEVCRSLEVDQLNARGIACSFDVEPGLLPQPVCDQLGIVVRALVLDAAEHAITGVGDKTIAVKLHRRRAIWACSVAHSGSRVSRVAKPGSWRAVAKVRAAELKASFRTRSDDRGTITAICFAVDRNSMPVSVAS